LDDPDDDTHTITAVAKLATPMDPATILTVRAVLASSRAAAASE
jgi:hypothetical protein